jgi:hypothetical protein
MIKLEHTIFYLKETVAFALEASSDKDLPALDLFREAFENKPGVKVGFSNTRRLIVHVTDMDKHHFKNEDGSYIKNI